MSDLVPSPSSFNLNRSDYVDTSTQQNTQLSSGIRSTAPAAAGSAAQMHAQLQQQTETDSARDDVSEPEAGDELWKYSFAIFLKVFVCYFVGKYLFAILFLQW